MNKNIWSISNCKISTVTFDFLTLVTNRHKIYDFAFFICLQIQIIVSHKNKTTKKLKP